MTPSTIFIADICKRELRGGLHGFRIFPCIRPWRRRHCRSRHRARLHPAGLAANGAAYFWGGRRRAVYLPFADPTNAWMASIAEKVSETTDFRS
jgi:hypothetical protein